MTKLISALLFVFISISANSQWRTIISTESNCKYFLGTEAPPDGWYTESFSDSDWETSKASIGYGDNDDTKIIGKVNSVFMRISFSVSDKTLIKKILLDADYDDGFVAYLNGTEIFRSSNLASAGDKVAFDYSGFKDHEATLYSGGEPERFSFSEEQLSLIKNGGNLLALQVQNVRTNSSDFSSNFFLSAEFSSSTNQYSDTPDWFTPPFSFTQSSLPIVVINTNGNTIVDEPKITATMGVINNGKGVVNKLSDSFTDYNGKIGIEIRGKSSQSFPKKQYSIELRDDAGEGIDSVLIGMKAEEDWVLYAPYADKSLVRNALTYELAHRIGVEAPHCRFCEVVINGEYKGVYLLTEKIKRDKNRVDIQKTSSKHNSGDELTGGYILKIDKIDGNEYWTSTNAYQGFPALKYIWVYPKPEKITNEQKDYIKGSVDSFEKLMMSGSYNNPETGYSSRVDIHSAIGMILMNELSNNMDGYRCSSYLYKKAYSNGGKFYMGPIWDYNYAYGNDPYHYGMSYTGWHIEETREFENNPFKTPFWWRRMWTDSDFNLRFAQRYHQLRKKEFTKDYLNNIIDSLVNVLGDAATRNFQKWPVLNHKIGPSPIHVGSFTKEVQFLKTWLTNRINWMDMQVEEPTDVIDPLFEERIDVYPNPFIDYINISLNSVEINEVNLTLYDVTGRVVWQKLGVENSSVDNNIRISFDDIALKQGVYFICVENKGDVVSRKIVRN